MSPDPLYTGSICHLTPSSPTLYTGTSSSLYRTAPCPISQWTKPLRSAMVTSIPICRYLQPSALAKIVLKDYSINISCPPHPPQLVSLLPASWYSDGSVVTRPLEGLVRYIVHLVECLDRAAAGQNNVERNTTR